MLTPGNEYAGVRQSPLSLPELLTTYVDPHPAAGAPVTARLGSRQAVGHLDGLAAATPRSPRAGTTSR